ncbi:unnamed protein product [Zymoseptoria tritici ST99CH_1E4]|uniref:Uncharacterized protein n=1 Tax=Zymoseptoria tritici ST99CH_1E4 TaxID=1276532 RepID=A0A2H1H4W2_ZYMTR|nr:unnamed protein product [Zymoseptoria tritici ST99CH_1E4]
MMLPRETVMYLDQTKAVDFENQSLLSGGRTNQNGTGQRWWPPWALLLPILTASHILSVAFGYGLGKLNAGNNEQPISPWMSSVDRSYHMARFNAFENPNNFTSDSAHGGHDVEDYWIEAGTYAKAVLVPMEYAEDFGLDRNIHQYFEPSTAHVPYAGFPANIQAMHQMHCIDFLRQGLFFNYEFYRGIHPVAWLNSTPELFVKHLSHCIDALRQHIMCEADLRVTGFLKNGPPDFATEKQCRNFTAVRDFAVEHQWEGADDNQDVDDHHRGYRTVVPPRLSAEELWRGY